VVKLQLQLLLLLLLLLRMLHAQLIAQSRV
jgi:hypothetical protein